MKKGISDLRRKAVRDRILNQYKGMPPETELTIEEAATIYRYITGAGGLETERFAMWMGASKKIRSLQNCIEIIKNQYNALSLEDFFCHDSR